MPMPVSLGWNAPPAHAVLDWQRRQEVFTRTGMMFLHLSLSIRAGSWTIMPTPALPTPGLDMADFAARILMRSESQRLVEARTYSIGPNTTGLAVATVAGSAPGEKISAARPPSPTGLMIFADPIGSDVTHHVTDQGTPFEIHTPIVAVSWSSWGPEQSQTLGGECPLTWIRRSQQHGLIPLSQDLAGIWMTFYSARTADTTGRTPSDVAAVDTYGNFISVHQSTQAEADLQRRHPDLHAPLTWHNELILPLGETFDQNPRPGTAQEWASIVYTTWQIMQQSGSRRLVEVTRHTLPPAARKKAKAQAKQRGQQQVGDGVVHVVDLAAAQQPPKKNADRDAAASDGHRKVAYSCRWPVPPHRRMTCLNPYLHHKLGDDEQLYHEHREDVMPFKIKGPADKPLKIKGGTTYSFDIDAVK